MENTNFESYGSETMWLHWSRAGYLKCLKETEMLASVWYHAQGSSQFQHCIAHIPSDVLTL